MKRLRLGDVARPRATDVVALGNFDGVHRGHQRLVEAVLAEARRGSGQAVVGTFEPHPARVLDPGRAPLSLTTLDQKAEVLEGLGVDCLVLLPFDRALARMEADEFVAVVLQQSLGARAVVAGRGFRYGRERRGDVASLGRAGLAVVEVGPELDDGRPISSTRIRAAVADGEVGLALRMLGRPFANDGVVVAGDGRGRGLGIPTANLAPENEALPAAGVYAAGCRIQGPAGWGARLLAVVNVGERPTFGGAGKRVEAHLIGWDGDLYGRHLRIEYEARLREERRFESIAGLVEQVRADIARARRLLENA